MIGRNRQSITGIRPFEALAGLLLILAVAGSPGASLDRAWAAQPGDSVRQERPGHGVPDPPGAKSEGAEVVARVNGETVTRAQFDRMVANPLTLRQARQELGVEEPDRKELERLAMRKLVHLRLLVQEAGRRKITVPQKELDEAITALRRRFDDLKDFGAWVKQQGLNDPELFETVRTDMLAKRVTAALAKGVRLTEDEAREYYEAHKEELIIGEEVRIRIIAVKDKAAAEEIVAALRKGEDFGRLARQRSLGMRAAQGGDTGWVDSRTLPPLLQTAVGPLSAGDAVGPLKKGDEEFLIVGLRGRRPLRAKSLAEARPEIERRLMPAKHRMVVEAWLTQQERESKIEMSPKPNKGRGARR
jgi:parvulin-like peptidyl-prolyl isomerase